MKEFKCRCGETNPNNFYNGNKSNCKSCQNKNRKYTYVKVLPRNKEYHIEYSYKPIFKKQKKEFSLIDNRLKTIKHKANVKNIVFDLTIQDVVDVLNNQHNKCFNTNKELSLDKNNDNSLCIDLIDENIGYIKSNIKLIIKENQLIKRRLHSDNFISKVEKAYPNKYTFENTVYRGMRKNVIVTCKKHGDFTTIPRNLTRSKWIDEENSVGCCQKCMDEHVDKIKLKYTDKLIKSHNKIYSYKLDTYKNPLSPMIAICKKHGEFNIIPDTHISGGYKCPKCSGFYIINDVNHIWCDIHHDVVVGNDRKKKSCPICNIEKQKKINSDKLINQFINSNYIVTNINNTNEYNFYCKTHHTSHIFNNNEIKSLRYKKNAFCCDCIDDEKNLITIERINKIKSIKEIINNNYFNYYEYIDFLPKNYVKLLNKFNSKIKIYHYNQILNKNLPINEKLFKYEITPKLSYDDAKIKVKENKITSFRQYLGWHKQTNQYDLPTNPFRYYVNDFISYYDFFDTEHMKRSRFSHGEKIIYDFLTHNNFKFKYQKSFKNCRDKNPLPFDFYIYDYNLIIEFDGEQHYVENNLFNSSLLEIQSHDEIKNKFCLDNNMKLLKIFWKKIIYIY